ncbi:MAG: tetratricopeptide (TPR) repeat protein [Polaribacter sp.]|jgi:tetratricopeptide (TPR) repeat protein
MQKRILIILFLFVIVKVGAQAPAFSSIDRLFENGRYQLALEKLEAIETPSFSSNYKIAVIYESIDNYKQTAHFLEKALHFKEDKNARLKLAKAYQRLNKSKISIKIYENLLAKDSLNLVLAYQLGKLYLKTKNHQKAIAVFKNLIERDAKNAHYSYQLGLSYAFVKERDLMINSFLNAHKKDTTHVRVISKLALSFFKLRDRDSTYLFVNKGLELEPNHTSLNRIRVNQFYREKKYKETIPVLLKLDSIKKMDLYNNTMLAKAYYNLEDFENAKLRFENAAALDNEDFKTFTYLGHIAMKQDKYSSAMFNYYRATATGKVKRDEEYYGLANAYYEMKRPKMALKFYEKAYEENFKNYKAKFQIAKITDALYKDKKMAYKHYKKYEERFLDSDKVMSAFVLKRISAIKKDYFMKGKTLE